MKTNEFEVIIIGGGAAGISAVLWCRELGLSAVILEAQGELGGQLLWTYNAIENHLGIKVKNGRELQKIFLQQLESGKFTAKPDSKVVEIETGRKKVKLAGGEILSGSALIVATGIRRRKLGLAGEDKFKGRGILESGQREAAKIAGKKVCVIGGGDAALENALILSEFAEKVILLHRRSEFRARPEFVEKVRQHQRIEVLTPAVVTKLLGENALEALEINGEKLIPADAVLLRLGVEPNTELVRGQIDLDPHGYCRIDANGETSVENVFAIGDVANPLAPTISGAVGMGATAVKTLFNKIHQ